MEQMKFEMGDPQQEAPKRIKKKTAPRKTLRVLLAVVALVLAAECCM